MFTFYQLSQVLVAFRVPAYLVAGLIAGSAITSSFAFLADMKARMTAQAPYSNVIVKHVGLGASGVVMGVTGAIACMAPKWKVYLFGVIPMPLWLFGVGAALYDTYFLGANTGIGHSAHLGGAAFGVAYYFLRLRKFRLGRF
jgi:membrane associated rhomboid family serine protease